MQKVRDIVYLSVLGIIFSVLMYGMVSGTLAKADMWLLGIALIVGLVIHVLSKSAEAAAASHKHEAMRYGPF